MKSRIKIVQYTFITYRLGMMGLSQTGVARIIGCTPEMLNQVIKGTKVSGNIQAKLAFILGYPSWQKQYEVTSDLQDRGFGNTMV